MFCMWIFVYLVCFYIITSWHYSLLDIPALWFLIVMFVTLLLRNSSLPLYQITLGSLGFLGWVWLHDVWMQLPYDLKFAIHSSIGLSSKDCHMGMGRLSSEGASGPVEGSGAAKPGVKASLDSWLAQTAQTVWKPTFQATKAVILKEKRQFQAHII